MSIDDFERAWPHLEPAVMRARQETKQSLHDHLERGQSRLWLLPNSAVTTKLLHYANGRKAFAIWLAGGELNELRDWADSTGLQAALDSKCNEMRIISGRRGWLRALGWRDIGSVAVRDLDNGR